MNEGPVRLAWQRFRRHRLAAAAGALLATLLVLTAIWPIFSRPVVARFLPHALTWDPDAISDAQFQPPTAEHWFGSDFHGRDLLSRVCHGARISLFVGMVGAAVSLVIGVLWGAVAGYCGGRWDGAMMRFVDILYSMPSIIFVIVLVTALNATLGKMQGRGGALSPGAAQTVQFVGLFAGLGAVSWLTMARIVRGQTLALRHRPFVDASRVLGASHARILLRHILPNVYGVIIVYLTLTIPSIMLSESFLSYLGLGVQPPQASLGSLIASGAEQIHPIRIYWWLVVFPAAALAITLLALNLLGDGLRDALDPREGGR